MSRFSTAGQGQVQPRGGRPNGLRSSEMLAYGERNREIRSDRE